ncbi:MAG: tetraacyldisaccharide 4'-kinase [Gammaproteobacteria bacterium]|nr:tetraacyldisaccharide 4'-kinase [Gammaproteobacteria bacterium]
MFRRWLLRVWYRGGPGGLLLLPLSWLFGLVVATRRQAYQMGLIKSRKIPVPVIVVGNITVGGSGKSPLVIWLVNRLAEAGYRPGVVTRGYGGRSSYWPQQVRGDSDPVVVGDEPVMLARRVACPVAADPDRVRAANALIEHYGCDLIVADDGLQHYRMKRDIEIAVLDGDRRLGNGYMLPAGPLREPERRLQQVDWIVSKGVPRRGEQKLTLQAVDFRRVDGAGQSELAFFARRKVHAVAAIGNPDQFFNKLRSLGLSPITHEYPDHHRYTAAELDFGDDLAVVMTEKDAVKVAPFAQSHWWYLYICPQLDDAFGAALLTQLESLR